MVLGGKKIMVFYFSCVKNYDLYHKEDNPQDDIYKCMSVKALYDDYNYVNEELESCKTPLRSE